jgi:hypothetical protein
VPATRRVPSSASRRPQPWIDALHAAWG